MEYIKITDIPGIKIGNEQDMNAGTGCTVIICEKGASAGVDVRGGSPGTRETDLLNPVNLVDKVHAVLLTGGSAFGLDAAAGIMQYLEERKIGYDMGATVVPIVTGAVLFDLSFGDYRIRPDKEMGYKACLNTQKNECPQGNAGAGTGATVGKILGMEYAMKGGLGTSCIKVGNLMVGAITAANCLGDIIDPSNGRIIAGTLNSDKMSFADTEKIMISMQSKGKDKFSGNTTISAVITNAKLDKSQANKVASMAHDGYGRTIRPSHSMYDGDTIFTVASCMEDADINVVGLLSAKVIEQSVINAIKSASSLHGLKCWRDLQDIK